MENRYLNTEHLRNNKYAAISQHEIDAIVKRLNHIKEQEKIQLSAKDERILALIHQVNELSQDIQSCDLPSDDADNVVLVSIVQKQVDAILEDKEKTWLQKLLDIAMLCKKNKAGNCMEKAIFGFVAMLYHLHTADWASEQKVSLELAYFNNHFIVIVDHKFLMDPWLNLSSVIPEKERLEKIFHNFGDLKDYFSIDASEQCYTHEIIQDAQTLLDPKSTQNMSHSLQVLEANTACFKFPAPKSPQKPLVEHNQIVHAEMALPNPSENEVNNEEDSDDFFNQFEKENFSPLKSPRSPAKIDASFTLYSPNSKKGIKKARIGNTAQDLRENTTSTSEYTKINRRLF